MIAEPSDRPRERLHALGPGALSSIELVALLLGTGIAGISAESLARSVLADVGGLRALARAAPAELATTAGVGVARAARLAAAFELGRRGIAEPAGAGPLLGPADVATRLRPRLHGLTQEVFVVLALDARMRLIDAIEVAVGVLDGVVVHPREVFRPLIRRGAAAAILVHNHPSGDPTPSDADREVTRRLRAVGDLVGIPVVDHIVVGGDRFASIAELDAGVEAP